MHGRTIVPIAAALLLVGSTVAPAVAAPARIAAIGVERSLPGITALDLTPNEPASSSIVQIDEAGETVVATGDGFVVVDTTTLLMSRREVLATGTRVDRSDDGATMVAVADGRLVTYGTSTWIDTRTVDLPAALADPLAVTLAPGSDTVALLETADGVGVVDGATTLVARFDTVPGVAGTVADAVWGDDADTLLALVGTRLVEVDVATGSPAAARTLDLPASTTGPLLWAGDVLALADGYTVDLARWRIGETFSAGSVPSGRREDDTLLLRRGLDVEVRSPGSATARFAMPVPFDTATAWMTPIGGGRAAAVGTDGYLRVLDLELLGGSDGDFVAVRPERIFDSREALGQQGTDPLGPADARAVRIDGVGPVPSGVAAAVVVNVTVVDATEPTFVSVYPTGADRPNVSVVNIDPTVAGRRLAVANLATVPIGDDGSITVFNANGDADVVLDVAGYYSDGGAPVAARYVPLDTPQRLADTRDGELGGRLGGDESRILDVGPEVGAGAVAAVVQITAVDPTVLTYVTASPAGGTRPFVSNVNPFPGRVSPNLAVVRLPATKRIELYNFAGSVDLAIDLVGWYEERTTIDQNGRFVAFEPVRRLDTRAASPFDGAVPAQGSVVFPSVGIDAFEPISSGDDTGWTYLTNLTAVESTSPGFLTARPVVVGSDFERPTTSNVNFGVGEIRANHAYVVAGPEWEVYNSSGDTHVVVDVFGAVTPADARLAPPTFGR